MSHKIAFYIRVSTEEQAKNLEGSIKNQKERLHQAVRFKNMEQNFGEVIGVFIDRAKSGKDTNRPELQNLLSRIHQGEINLVMVTELSRISRNIKNFAEIWEMMKARQCGFMSLRENFDTTTAAGEMVLYTVANIAQFERRQVSERVAANIKARAERGLYNGGSVPLGYKIIPDKPGFLAIDDDAKGTVQAAFDAFLKEESLSKAARSLNEKGYNLKKTKQGGGRFQRLSHFTVDNLHKMLTNQAYVGVKVYKDGEIKSETKAVWEPIVDEVTFKRVQEKLKKNKSRKKPHTKERYPYLLSGLVYCAHCSDVICGKSAHGNGGKIGYYEHSWATKRESCLTKKTFQCEPHRVLAKKLEPLVLDKVRLLLFDSDGLAQTLVAKAQAVHKSNSSRTERKSAKAKISGLNSQLDALAERLSQIPGNISAAPIFKQMEILQRRKEKYEQEIALVERQSQPLWEMPMELQSYQSLLKALRAEFTKAKNPKVLSSIIQRLVHKVEVGADFVKIHYNLAQDPGLLFRLGS